MIAAAGYDDPYQLYCDWVDGIETGRLASLWELERLKRQEGLEWRCSGKIHKQVMERKILIYAVLRQLPEPARVLAMAEHAGSLSACASYQILLLLITCCNCITEHSPKLQHQPARQIE